MKEAYQKTIEKCSDCEKFLDECYPQHFLEVVPKNEDSTWSDAYEDQPECKQMQLDTKSVIKDILAMTLTRVNLLKSDIPSGNSETSISASPENKWGDRRIVYVPSSTRKK